MMKTVATTRGAFVRLLSLILRTCLLSLALALPHLPVFAQGSQPAYSFGVLSQRSAVLTAQYWNPLLGYVEHKTGVRLELKVARSAPESNDATERGVYDFVYSNTIFQPRLAAAGYQVILRPRAEGIHAQIVTLEGSAIHDLTDLAGREVGFPSPVAFVGYAVPMDYLLRQGLKVEPVFGGNQEGIMGQLKIGRVVAAGVNDQVMRAFASREGVKYRVLWQSSAFNNLPIAVHPRVPAEVVRAVRQAVDDMDTDPQGQRIQQTMANFHGSGEQHPRS
jgi:phosphonate transport system substrate-binding protein